jgi:tRNA G18 (ribose-2'-O)-methylase SpoU
MPGGIESLNVSAAAAVTLFRVIARRGTGSSEVSS